MAFPSFDPFWAINNTYPDGVTPNKIRPAEPLRQYGYPKETKVTAEELNWQLNNLYLQIAELKTLSAAASQIPVNTLVFIDGDTRNPAVIYGYGSWVPYAQGRVIIGHGTGTDDNGVQRSFNSGSTGGEYAHTLSNSEMPSHSHPYKDTYLYENAGNTGSIPASSKETVGFVNGGLGSGRADFDNDTMVFRDRTTDSVGAGQAHNNVQPYVSVNIWKRVS